MPVKFLPNIIFMQKLRLKTIMMIYYKFSKNTVDNKVEQSIIKTKSLIFCANKSKRLLF